MTEDPTTIELRCPGCGLSKSVPRQPDDYPEAVRVEIRCVWCNPGDFDGSAHYDAQGNHITRDPMICE